MKKWISRALFCSALFLTGCGGREPLGRESPSQAMAYLETSINPDDVQEEQLIEILSPQKTIVCQITGKTALIDYFEHENFAKWEQADAVPQEARLQRIVMSYEKVTDDFWLKRGAPSISTGEEWLYAHNGAFYLKAFSDSGEETAYRIPADAGKYMMELAQESSGYLEKEDIFASWGIDREDMDAELAKETSTDTLSGEVFQETAGKEKGESRHIYTAKDLKRVSREQKLEVHYLDSDMVFTVTDLEEIADFYNQIRRDTWTEAEGLPEGSRKLCTLTSYQLQRHTTQKNLVENEELNVYNFQDAYYILDRIPGSLAGVEDMERCYLVSNEVAEYITGMASDRKYD